MTADTLLGRIETPKLRERLILDRCRNDETEKERAIPPPGLPLLRTELHESQRVPEDALAKRAIGDMGRGKARTLMLVPPVTATLEGEI